MTIKSYAIVGCWDWDGSTKEKGLRVCRYHSETGHIELLSGILPEIKVGFQPLLHKNSKLYFVEEQKHTDNHKNGGGGYVYVVQFHPENERLFVVCRRESLGVNPCGCALSKSGEFLLVVHHTSTKDTATKLMRNVDGTITNKIIYDDAAIVLFRIAEDGCIQEVCDYAVHEPQNDKASLLHAVYSYHNHFIICDKGLDCLYSYDVDEEQGKLRLQDTIHVEQGSKPRYCAFHPIKPLFYGSNEGCEKIYTYCCNPENGKLSVLCETSLHVKGEKEQGHMSSDIMITPDGRFLYVALRGINQLISFELDEKGIPRRRGAICCGGINPRGLSIDPDGMFLYSCNTESDDITCFKIQEDGGLLKQESIKISRPANMMFLDINEEGSENACVSR